MNTRMNRLLAWLLGLLLILPGMAGGRAEAAPEVTLLFTTDIHSHAVPHTERINGVAQQVGGYARLKTAVEANRVEGRTLLLDSGDYSMATLYQTYTVSDALDLSLMQAVGYDAVALGNHDFEVTEQGLKDELTLFYQKGGAFPLLCSNLAEGKTAGVAQDDNPLAAYGVRNYAVFTLNGIRVGVFAMMGSEASSYTPVTTLTFADPIQTAKATVKQLREVEKVDLVVLLDHAGTMPDGSFHEDADVAKAVDGVDVVLSGHMHVPMMEAQTVNGAVIVCAGTALNYLGRLDLYREGDGWRADYQLLPLTDQWQADEAVQAMIAPYSQKLDEEYFSAYGVSAKQDDEIAYSPYDFPDGDTMCQTLQNYAFGALITDGYRYAASRLGAEAWVGITPVGSVRGGLYKGKWLMEDLYNALSYGISPLDGSCASPMVTFWLTGRELYDVCETCVSVSDIINSAQLLMGGIHCEYSDLRPMFNKVFSAEVYHPGAEAWEYVERSESRLYPVTCSWQSLQAISLIKSSTFGLLSIEPKDEQGLPLDTPEKQQSRILRLPSGAELKEWDAVYQYLNTMATGADGLPVVKAQYGQAPDYLRKADASLTTFFVNPNKAAWLQYGAAAALILLAVLICSALKRRHRRKRQAKGRSADQPKAV